MHATPQDEDKWVFGYGSLMWKPGFAHVEALEARLFGVHRAFCVYSWVHRGTQAAPGLVLGLDRGGSVRGMAFRVLARDWDEVFAYLQAREQSTAVYVEAWKALRLSDGRRVRGLCFVVDRNHPQYAGALPLERQAEIIATAVGGSGPNTEYLENTVAHLDAMGLGDGPLHRVQALLKRR